MVGEHRTPTRCPTCGKPAAGVSWTRYHHHRVHGVKLLADPSEWGGAVADRREEIQNAEGETYRDRERANRLERLSE